MVLSQAGSTVAGMTTDLRRLVLGDDWPGAWDLVDWARPEDWRDVSDQVVWEVAVAAAAWVFLEASPDDTSLHDGVRDALWRVAEVLQDDLPWFLGVGPTTPAGRGQPQLPMVDLDNDPLERLSERPDGLSWHGHFALTMQERRATCLRRADVVGLHGLGEDVVDQLTANLMAQVATQVEWLLRDQEPTMLPFLEESLACHLEDAALGAALHVVTDGDRAIGLCLVSHDGRPRGMLPVRAPDGAHLADLVAALALGVV